MKRIPPKKREKPYQSVRLSAVAPNAQLIEREVLLSAIVVMREGVQLPESKWEYVNLRLSRSEARELAVQLLDPEKAY